MEGFLLPRQFNMCDFLYILQVSLTQARIDMSELDEDSDGFLQPHVSLLHIYVFKDWLCKF